MKTIGSQTFVSLETSKMLKEIGFKSEHLQAFYILKSNSYHKKAGDFQYFDRIQPLNCESELSVVAPTQDQARKYMIDNYQVHPWVQQRATYYEAWVNKYKVRDQPEYMSYEEALELALQTSMKTYVEMVKTPKVVAT